MIGMFMQRIVVNGSIWLMISSLFSGLFLIVIYSAKIFLGIYYLYLGQFPPGMVYFFFFFFSLAGGLILQTNQILFG